MIPRIELNMYSPLIEAEFRFREHGAKFCRGPIFLGKKEVIKNSLAIIRGFI